MAGHTAEVQEKSPLATSNPNTDVDSCQRRNNLSPPKDSSVPDQHGHAHQHASALETGTGVPLTPAISATSLAPATTNDDDDFPDGGWAAWSVVFGAWCAFVCTFGIFNCSGVFVQVYSESILRDTSLSLISWIPALQGFAMDSSTAVVGRAFDSYGHRWLLYSGTLIFIFGLMMTSLSTQYYQFLLAQGIVCGIGQSCISTTTMACIMTWFKRRRAAALGIAISGSAVGGIALPILLVQLIPRIGFGWTMRVMGLLCLCLCVTACVLVSSRLKPKPQPLLLRDYTQPFKEKESALLFLGCFLFFGGMFVPQSYILVQARNAGFDPELVVYLIPIWSAASIPGRIIPGLLADKVGRFNLTTLWLGASAVITLALWLPGVNSTPALWAYAVLFGFVAGSIFSLAPACVAQVSKIREVGTRTGIAFGLGGVGVLISPPIAGAILESMGGQEYWGLQVFCGLEMLAGMLCFGASRVLQKGWKWTKV
ncbi:major facilitator superfamily domain-containing protein [Microdochium bolleyi]|uniref:Major facilitator superfamily domain-containing protein n=1 Tax=Microdochium bolleyi TaxID=196109 RepID=A0A136JDD4_9PEZI|nr:major facilitator superfamily domain-containing protein [Microdochium bolleyi]